MIRLCPKDGLQGSESQDFSGLEKDYNLEVLRKPRGGIARTYWREREKRLITNLNNPGCGGSQEALLTIRNAEGVVLSSERISLKDCRGRFEWPDHIVGGVSVFSVTAQIGSSEETQPVVVLKIAH